MNTRKLGSRILITVGSIAMLVGAFDPMTGRAESPVSHDFEFDVQPLSVSVSRLERDAFGNPRNPFGFISINELDPGTVVLAKITPRGDARWQIQPEHCRVVSFRDDLGTDLSTNAAPASEDHFFPRNRLLDVLDARDNSRCWGFRVRSQRVPAAGATRLIADVVLLCRLDSKEQSKERQDVLIQANEVVTVGPLQLKFMASTCGELPAARTNKAVIAKSSRYRLAAFLPQNDVAIASVTFFSSKSDDPILSAKNITAEGMAGSSNPSVTERRPQAKPSSDPFANCIGYGFTPPEDGKVTIKVRYYDRKSLVEKHCIITTGLSL
jgi:hypothetical protein